MNRFIAFLLVYFGALDVAKTFCGIATGSTQQAVLFWVSFALSIYIAIHVIWPERRGWFD